MTGGARTPAPVRVAVLGAGSMGAHHAHRLSRHVAGAAVTRIVGASATRASHVASAIPGSRPGTDPHQAINDPDVDAVVIATPDDTHVDLTLACIQAGKPVLCEKPLALTSADAAIVAAAEDRARRSTGRGLVQLGFMRRFDPDLRGLRDSIAGQELGAALLLHCVHRNAAAPAGFTTEQIITSSLVHEIDTTRYLLGEELAAVTVLSPRPSPSAPLGLRDPLLVVLESSSGRLIDVECFVSTGVGYEVRVELVAEHGSMTVGLPDGPRRQTGVHGLGVRGVPMPADFIERFALAFDAQLQAWIDAIVYGSGVGGPGASDGLAAALACEAALHSLATGTRVAIAPPSYPTSAFELLSPAVANTKAHPHNAPLEIS